MELAVILLGKNYIPYIFLCYASQTHFCRPNGGALGMGACMHNLMLCPLAKLDSDATQLFSTSTN